MKRFLALLATGALAFGISSSAQAQLIRSFEAGALILDDNAGHTITIQTPQPGDPGYAAWAAGGPLIWRVPIPPVPGADAAFVLPGTVAGQALMWDMPSSSGGTGGPQGTWRATAGSGVTILGAGTTNTIPKFTGAAVIGNSQISDAGGATGITFSSYGLGILHSSGIGVLSSGLIAAADIATGAVTSAGILDGTIVDADVNAAAAIAGTKISPNFGSQAVTTSGNISATGAGTITSAGLLTASNGLTVSAGTASFGANAVTGSNFQITGSTMSGTAITTSSLNSTPVGAGTPSTGAFTTLASSGNSTVATGAGTTNTFGTGATAANTIGNATGTNVLNGANTINGASTFNNTAAFGANNVSGSNFTITGGSIASTPISGSTGSFTTLASSGNSTVATGAGTTNSFGTGATAANTIGNATGTNAINGANTINGATTWNNTSSHGANNVSGSNFTITGGSITGTTISGSTGSFTTLASSGNSTIATGAATTNSFGTGATAANTIGNAGGTNAINGTNTINGATTWNGASAHGANNVSGSNFTITGGSITGTTISGSTGSFTTLASSGNSTIATGAATTNSFGTGATAANTIGNAGGTNAINGTNTINGATTWNSTSSHGANNVSGSNFTITGGSIASTPISGSTGSFTTLASTGNSTIATGAATTNSFGTGATAANTIGNAGGTNAINGTNTINGASTFNSTAAFGANAVTGSNFQITGASMSGTAITASSLNSSPVGAGTPSTGAFTTLNSTGATTLSGIGGLGVVHSSAAGVLSSSTIVNADVDAAAAIAGTKISPNFGNQAVSTTGTYTTGSPTVLGQVIFGDGTNAFTGTLETAPLTGSHVYQLPDRAGTFFATTSIPTYTDVVLLQPSAIQLMPAASTADGIQVEEGAGATGAFLVFYDATPTPIFTVANTGSLTSLDYINISNSTQNSRISGAAGAPVLLLNSTGGAGSIGLAVGTAGQADQGIFVQSNSFDAIFAGTGQTAALSLSGTSAAAGIAIDGSGGTYDNGIHMSGLGAGTATFGAKFEGNATITDANTNSALVVKSGEINIARQARDAANNGGANIITEDDGTAADRGPSGVVDLPAFIANPGANALTSGTVQVFNNYAKATSIVIATILNGEDAHIDHANESISADVESRGAGQFTVRVTRHGSGAGSATGNWTPRVGFLVINAGK